MCIYIYVLTIPFCSGIVNAYDHHMYLKCYYFSIQSIIRICAGRRRQGSGRNVVMGALFRAVKSQSAASY